MQLNASGQELAGCGKPKGFASLDLMGWLDGWVVGGVTSFSGKKVSSLGGQA